MASCISNRARRVSGSFHRVVAAFLGGEGLPFSAILSADRIERIFCKHNCLFGAHGVYSTAVMVWAFLAQVLSDGKQASCRAAVARVVAYCHQQGLNAPTEDTGDYCRARAKLSENAIKELACETAEALEHAAQPEWLWKGMHHAKLVDGFTLTMPDTPKNQQAFPQQKAQKPGVGLPIARTVAITSLATACVLDLELGPYKGKETGESALLRSMLHSFNERDVVVMDRCYCSFLMIALLFSRGTSVCARKHHRRHSDFRRGERLGKYDHLITWARPVRPEWMEEEVYQQIPETLVLREIRYNAVVPGRRTQTLDVITTLVDPDVYTKEDIAELYGFRWNAELDIRSLKSNLNLGHVRCKSPKMVRLEVWTTILAYNLIRATAAGAAVIHRKQPRAISFTGTCQYVLAAWMQLSTGAVPKAILNDYLLQILKHIAACQVANRPGRVEPRVIKRRRHGYKLMQKPRESLRDELRKICT